MLIICPFCKSKSHITRTNTMNNECTTRELYCSCSNHHACGARFVYTLMLKHVINEPSHTALELAQQMVNNLNFEQQEELKRNMPALLAGA